MRQLEARKDELERISAEVSDPPALLHPSLAEVCRTRIDALAGALARQDTREKAAEMLRLLVSEIVLTPEDGTLQIDVPGDLAGILAVSLKRKSPAVLRAGRS